jgi:vacuolar-type H+-ATPase subunit H
VKEIDLLVQDSEGDKLRRKLKPSEIQVVKQVDNKIDRNIIKEQAAEKKQRQIINKLVRGAEMKKEEALKALDKIKNDTSSPARNTRSKKKL